MKLQYLGTAAAEGWPALFCRCESCRAARKLGGRHLRTRSQSIIDDRLLIDFPPDTYMHMLTHFVNLPDIKHCLITHCHSDHLYTGDLSMRSGAFARELEGEDISFYGNDTFVKTMDDFAAAKARQLNIKWHELTEYVTVHIGGYSVTPILARHNPAEKCLNYIISDGQKTLLYLHDTGFPKDETWDFLKNFRFDLVSCDCTVLVKQMDGGGHMSFADNIRVRERMIREGMASENTVFVANHFSHNGAFAPDGKVWLYEETDAMMRKKGFIMSYDGMTVTV